MNIPGLSTNGLLMMHTSILQAIAIDDNLPAGREKTYEVRECPDWRHHADAIEAELRARSVGFQPVPW